MYRVWTYVANTPLLLLLGMALGLGWANLAPVSFTFVTEFPLLFGSWIGRDAGLWLGAAGGAFGIDDLGDVDRVLTPAYLVADIGMAIVFAMAAKEAWEAAILRQGALRGRRAMVPLGATLGGATAAAGLFLALSAVLGSDAWDAASRAWAAPVSTDVALTWIAGRAIFGARHPAMRMLLVLAVADDVLAFAILALFFPAAPVAPGWLILPALAAATVWLACVAWPARRDRGNPARPATTRVRRRMGLWPYALAAAVSWVGVTRAGLHPALGLLPIVPAFPHATRAFGLFAEAERFLHDPLNRAQRALRGPAEIVLFLFAVVAAGVPLGAVDASSGALWAALVLGKPVGVVLGAWAMIAVAGPLRGVAARDLVVIGALAGCAVTWPLFLSNAALPLSAEGAALRIGALGSLVAVLVAAVLARALGVARRG